MDQHHVPGRAFAVLGAHGGAGASTVATFLDPRRSGRVIELARGAHLPPQYIPLLVARSTAFGMLKAAELLGTWHSQVPRPWLVIVRDAPAPLPKAVIYRRRAVASRVLGTAEVPYLYRLRAVDAPADALDHRAVQRAAERLRTQLGLPE